MDKDTAIWTAICVLVGVGVTMTGFISVYLGYSCLGLAGILALYQTKKWWIKWLLGPKNQQTTDTQIIHPDQLQHDEIMSLTEAVEKLRQEGLNKQAPLLMRSEVINVAYPHSSVYGGITWTPDLMDLRVAIENPNDDDYKDIDVTIRADHPNVYIKAIGQISNLPGVTFVNPGLQLLGFDKKGNPIVKFDSATGHLLKDGWKIVTLGTENTLLPNYYRIRCEKLPHRTTLEITLAIAKRFILDPNGKINNVWIKGQYYGGSQLQNIDQNIKVSN